MSGKPHVAQAVPSPVKGVGERCRFLRWRGGRRAFDSHPNGGEGPGSTLPKRVDLIGRCLFSMSFGLNSVPSTGPAGSARRSRWARATRPRCAGISSSNAKQRMDVVVAQVYSYMCIYMYTYVQRLGFKAA